MPSDRQLRRAAEPLWYWMRERHAIWERRAAGEPREKWTKDPILRAYRFCNVYRELDTTTKWIRERWREPMAKSQHLWFAMYVARMINHPPTLHTLQEPRAAIDWCDHAHSTLRMRAAGQSKVYGSAYIITAGGRSGPKWRYTMACFRAAIKQPPFGNRVSIEATWDHLRTLPGCGPFVAYEVATDLRWTRYYDGSDHMSWANPGPGAMRGINRILTGKSEKSNLKRADYIQLMADLTCLANEHPKLKHMPRFEARDIEHSLCETDKMLRAKTGEGRPKQRYEPA